MRFNHVSRFMLLMMIFFFLAQSALAFGGRVLYQDGNPAAGAEVIVTGGGQGRAVVTSDAEGHFELGSLPDGGMVRIKASGKDYAPLKLPASLFATGDVAIILQPKESMSKTKK